jgi:hypothetical protein
MAFTQHTECVEPENYSGPFIGSTGFYAAITAAIIGAVLDPGASLLAFVIGGIAYCRWWLYGRLVCLGGDSCMIGLAMGVYTQANQVGFLGKFDTDVGVQILLAPSLLTDSIEDVANKNLIQGHLIQDQRFCNNPPNPKQAAMVTMYENFSNLSFTGELESPADVVGASGQIDQDDNLNIGGQGVLTPAQGDSIGLVAPGSLNPEGLVVPDEWQANNFYVPGAQISDSNGNLQMCTPFSEGLSGANEPTWTGLISITAWSISTADPTTVTFTANNSLAAGDAVVLSGFRNSLFFNGATANVLATGLSSTQFQASFTPIKIGSELETGSATESGSGLTLGSLTMDNAVQWSAQGPPAPGVGTMEVEFEGSGVYDLYQALLVALIPAGVAAVLCAFPLVIITWIGCLIAAAVALLIAGIGALIAQVDSSPTVTVSGGTIHPGQDILFVMGRWILDSAHSGWNELHPVLSCQKVGTVDHANLIAGNPWKGTVFEHPSRLKAVLQAMCDGTKEANNPSTKTAQANPQNQWVLHPLVDGCTSRPNIE